MSPLPRPCDHCGKRIVNRTRHQKNCQDCINFLKGGRNKLCKFSSGNHLYCTHRNNRDIRCRKSNRLYAKRCLRKFCPLYGN